MFLTEQKIKKWSDMMSEKPFLVNVLCIFLIISSPILADVLMGFVGDFMVFCAKALGKCKE